MNWTEEYLTNCVMFILEKKKTGWTKSDESFYNEYDFICHARFQKDSIPNSSQTSSIQTETFLHREVI